MSFWAFRVPEGERLDSVVKNTFDQLIASLEPILSKLEVDPRDPTTGNVLYGQLGIRAPLQVLNTWNFPTLSVLLGSNINTFDHQNRVLLRLRPDGAARTINGFLAPTSPDQTPVLIVYNDSTTYALTLANQSTSATQVRDRMILTGAANVVLASGDSRSVWLAYSHTLNRWVQINAMNVGSNLLDVTAGLLTVENTTTETDVYNFTLPANTLANGNAIKMHLIGTYVKSAGAAASFGVEISLGGTNIVTGNVQTGIGSTADRRMLWLELLISAVAAAGQRAIVTGKFGPPSGSAIQAWNDAGANLFAYHDSLTLDDTTALALRVAVTHSVADAGIIFRRQLAFVENLPNT